MRRDFDVILKKRLILEHGLAGGAHLQAKKHMLGSDALGLEGVTEKEENAVALA
jgi:hypothetical protein